MSVQDIPEDHTIITKIPSAADILSGDAVRDGNDTTGGTPRLVDKVPEEITDIPTEKEINIFTNTGNLISIGLVILIGIVTYILIRRKK